MTECTMDETMRAWNDGFKGYAVNLHMDIDSFLKRTVQEKLSPRYSLVAFDETKPVGVLVSGIKERGGLKVAWNGGTGVHPDYRNKKVGRRLVEASLGLYKEEGVDLATLEAISNNDAAIHLYEKHGYAVEDYLSIFRYSGMIDLEKEVELEEKNLTAQDVSEIDWYPDVLPWQCHEVQGVPLSIKGFYLEDNLIGYSVCKESVGEDHSIQVVYHQLEMNPEYLTKESLIQSFLSRAIRSDEDISRSIINMRQKSSLHPHIEEIGFQEVFKQVWMLQSIATTR